MQITLRQFEQINELFNACLHRPDLEQVMAHPHASADYVRNVYFRPEWALFDACVLAIGFNAADKFASAIDCAAHVLTYAEVVDAEALDFVVA